MKRRRSAPDALEIRQGDVDAGMVVSGPLTAVTPSYEYKSVILPRLADLNSYGKQGWELVSVTAQPGDNAIYYFRRVKK